MQVRVRRSSESSNPRGLICFAAAGDCCFSFLHINQYRSPAQPRKRDQPQVICPEGSAAIVHWWLLPIHRFFDNAALQQGSGMDHLLQAGVSVPLSGVWSLNTHIHTHTQTAIFSMHSQIPFTRSQWITCCPMVPAHKQVFPLIYFSAPLPPAFLANPSAY